MINNIMTYKEKSIMENLHKILVRPHLEYCVINAWSPHYAKDKELLEKMQKTVQIKNLEFMDNGGK